MSKQTTPISRVRVTTIAAITLVCFAVTITNVLSVVHAQQTVQQATPRAAQKTVTTIVPNAKSAAVAAATEEVVREVAQIRGLNALRPIKSGAQTRAEIERMIVDNLNRETKPEEIRTAELALKKLGLAPADFNYRQLIINLLTEQVAGYYDPKRQEFFLADWIDLDGQRPVMAHELTHALQDQHFDLKRFQNWKKGDSDAELAAQALVEGDATLVMEQYIQRDMRRALAFMRSMMSGDTALSTKQLDAAPAALRRTLTFPYETGLSFARAVWREGGWDAVSKVYKDLPASTEQVMHPEKYLARETPLKITLPDFTQPLGKTWKRLDTDINGEWSLYLILEEYLKDDATSRRAAAGWHGDGYALYEKGTTGEVAIMQFTAWDTENDAQEFYDAYIKRTKARYNDAQAINTKSLTRGTFQTTEGTVIIERQGTQVRIAEGVPQNAKLSLFD